MELDSLTDMQLVALARERHEGAQSLLYRKYVDRIYGFFVAQVRHPEIAEDLTQETFIKALQGLANFRGVASFKNWLYRIAKNQLADHFRDQHAHLVELDEALPPRALQKDAGDDELREIEERRSVRVLGRIFKSLPDRYIKVLSLRFLQGFSLKETAAAMSLSLSNVKVLQHRALRLARQKTDALQ